MKSPIKLIKKIPLEIPKQKYNNKKERRKK